MGPTEINLNLLNTAANDQIGERNITKASLIISTSNYEPLSSLIKLSDNPIQQPISKLPTATTTPFSFCPVPHRDSTFCFVILRESCISNNFNSSKGGKSSKASKIVKHYIRKQTSFNNIWTTLLKLELNRVCSLKAPTSAPRSPAQNFHLRKKT